jgi:hypothetical protein
MEGVRGERGGMVKARRWAGGGRENMVVSVEERGFNGAVRAIIRSDDITG